MHEHLVSKPRTLYVDLDFRCCIIVCGHLFKMVGEE